MNRRTTTHSQLNLTKAARFSRKPGGFTLIEMLLVIALMALMVSLGILAYRNNTATHRVNKAALETQNILAAGMAYRSDQGNWPTAHDGVSCSTTEPDTSDTFVTSYLPNANAETTYGGYYCWGVSDNSSLFWVALEVPGDDANLAKQIAAQLPNAIDTTEPNDSQQAACPDDSSLPCYARAEVSQFTSNTSNSSSLAGVGYCDPSDAGATVSGSSNDVTCTQNTAERDQYTVAFYCPTGQTGTVFVVPNFYSNPGGNSTTDANLTHLSAAGSSVDTCTAQEESGETHWTCTINLIAQYDGTNNVVDAKHLSNGTIGATYTAFCKSATATARKPTITQTYHY